MEQFNKDQVRRIWQRVQGEKAEHTPHHPPEPCAGIPEAIVRELTCAATYTRLAKQFPQRIGNLLRKLAREEQQHAAILKGICALSGGFYSPVRPMPAEKDTAEVLLRRCYAQKLQAIAEYEKRAADPAHGNVFQKLVQQEQAQCHILLQIIGSLGKNGMHP